MDVVAVRAFKDNYVWTLRNATHAAVVDPGEARPVLDYLARENLKLAAWLYRSRVLAGATALLGALTLGLAHAYNHAKPTGLGGSTPVWSRRAANSAASFTSSARSAPVAPGVDDAICSRSTLGASGTERGSQQ